MQPVNTAILGLGLCLLLLFGCALRFRPQSWEQEEFQLFIKKFNKSYGSAVEYNQRFAAFCKSLHLIDTLNANRSHPSSARYGLTTYSDLDADEFLSNHLQTNYYERMQQSRKHCVRHRRHLDAITSQIPRKVDWRSLGVVTPVNNQYGCGACWAFSAIETIESMHAIRTGDLLTLSTQQMIDCAGYRNNGCKGGDICTLLAWLIDFNVTIHTADEYPLSWRQQTCQTTPLEAKSSVHLASFECHALANDEAFLLEAIVHGPVAVAINAVTWQNYLGGVIQYHCSEDVRLMNHAVQVVGYDLDAEIPHFVVRNSWGAEFGVGGYLYVGVGSNLCGIANEVSIVDA